MEYTNGEKTGLNKYETKVSWNITVKGSEGLEVEWVMTSMWTTVRSRFQMGPEQVRSRIGEGLMDNWRGVTGRTWLQLMCCTHSYD